MSRNDIVLSVQVGDGKYTVQQDRKGMLTALRHGEEWRNCCGDGSDPDLGSRGIWIASQAEKAWSKY